MKKAFTAIFLTILGIIPLPALAQKAPVDQVMRSEELTNQSQKLMQPINQERPGTLVRKIVIEGFVPRDRKSFDQLFKSSLNKRLSAIDIDTLIAAVKYLYAQEGYDGLVEISYRIVKRTVKIRAFLVNL